MTKYTRSADTFFPHTDSALDVQSKLPPGFYTIGVHPDRGYFFAIERAMTLPPKLYGNVPGVAERIIHTFKDRKGNTGVLLEGDKGSGKSLTMSAVCVGLAPEVPIILINAPHCGEGFDKFITAVDQPIVIVYDEFEKVFDDEDQNKVLTLMDGVFSTNILFMLTVNDKSKVNQFMHNRPGRLFYNLQYGGLDLATITGYCEDNLKDQTQLDGLIMVSQAVGMFNFDMLKALVQEMNRYNEPAATAVRMMNIRPENPRNTYYTARFLPDSNGMINVASDGTQFIFPNSDVSVYFDGRSPLASASRMSVTYVNKVKKAELIAAGEVRGEKEHDIDLDDARTSLSLILSSRTFRGIDRKTGSMIFQPPGCSEIILDREERFSDSHNWLIGL